MSGVSNWAVYFKTNADYILASCMGHKNLSEVAADVRFHPDNKITVRDLVEARACHGGNSMIYEAWVYETGNQVYRLISQVDSPILKEAIYTHAKSLGYFDGDASSAQEAIREASKALYDYDEEHDDEEYKDDC